MKIIHVTDIHLTAKGGLVLDKDPGQNLLACLEHIMVFHPDADMCVITGDLCHWGEDDAYLYLREILSDFSLPVRLLLGNHDNREKFAACSLKAERDENGYVQWYESTKVGRFIYLDTIEPMTHEGHYGEDRQAWLERTLKACAGEPCYVFMHHHPAPIGLSAIDKIGQKHTKELCEIFRSYKSQIKYIFHGHCHLPLAGTVCGIPFSGLRGTNHQSWQDFTSSPTLKSASLTPAYNVVLINDDDCVIHTIDFSYKGQIEEFGTAFKDWSKD